MGYMREKRQFAQVNDQTSEMIDLQFRVAQDSILRLALSALYANVPEYVLHKLQTSVSMIAFIFKQLTAVNTLASSVL